MFCEWYAVVLSINIDFFPELFRIKCIELRFLFLKNIVIFLAALWKLDENKKLTNENGITLKNMWIIIPALGKPDYLLNDVGQVLSVVGETPEDARKSGAQVKETAKESDVTEKWKVDRQMWTISKNVVGKDYFALTNVHSKTLLHANSQGIMSITNTIPVITNRTKDLNVPDEMKNKTGISTINMQFISLKLKLIRSNCTSNLYH